MSTPAQPSVSGKRLILACHSASNGGAVVLGTFSCHWAAVAAMVRLRQPDFKSMGGDNPADLAVEAGLRAAIAKAKGIPHTEPVTGRPFCTFCGGDFGKHTPECVKSKTRITAWPHAKSTGSPS